MSSQMATVTALQLQQLNRRCDYQALAKPLAAACAKYKIDTARRVRHFVAQLCVESAGLTRFEENLNYSAKRLTEVWPKRFPSLAAAAPFAGNPQALANKTYGGRGGNTGPNDGWLYRGRGPLMSTFHCNYAEAQDLTGLPLLAHPDLLLKPEVGFDVAGAFWWSRGCNELVDEDPGEKPLATIEASIRANEEDDLRAARLKVNGGLIGLDDARAWLIKTGFIWRD
ncbi:glycoside hydrolase family 19 protein [Caulobacter sp. X]|uniref:glycoside hydrolase family 19 protein n=1 Tax=Caulobacter sp. X TaxID=2048901 RepID=UPI000C15A6D6|nr:glycoside hydrolase family 19 protein [Caulobacter sp. X]PIB96520.1 chitinase [Caulobacter sp. X]